MQSGNVDDKLTGILNEFDFSKNLFGVFGKTESADNVDRYSVRVISDSNGEITEVACIVYFKNTNPEEPLKMASLYVKLQANKPVTFLYKDVEGKSRYLWLRDRPKSVLERKLFRYELIIYPNTEIFEENQLSILYTTLCNMVAQNGLSGFYFWIEQYLIFAELNQLLKPKAV